MRKSTRSITPKSNAAVHDDSVSNNADRSGAKKLRQARLPFKVIASGITPAGSKTATTLTAENDEELIKGIPSTDSRKRKLSYSADEDGSNTDDIKKDDNVSKENVETLRATTKKKKISIGNNSVTTESDIVVSLLDDDEDNGEYSKADVGNSSINGLVKQDLNIKTPKASVKDKRKSQTTPQQTSSDQKDKNSSLTKLQIKLPLSGGKKKRRKSHLNQLQQNSGDETPNKLSPKISSDEIEDNVDELNPQKRKKLNAESDEGNQGETKQSRNEEHNLEFINLNTEAEEEEGVTEQTEKLIIEKHKAKNEKTKSQKGKDKASSSKTKSISTSRESSPNARKDFEKSSDIGDDNCIELSDSSDENEPQKNDQESLQKSAPSENEADDETDNLGDKSNNISSDIRENSKSKTNMGALKSVKNEKNSSPSAKTLTPKQIKLMEQRRRAREEKERKLQEEKLKKQQEKEEKEMVKKREREEKEEQKRKEREEKEDQRRKEREEKERKRLAEVEAKNEEKRKKNEAKEEELRKKEEERKRKEQEKEEAELKKKKAAQAFTKFFVAKPPINVQSKTEEDSNTGDGTKLLAFRPFQIKGDMKLAPICRKTLTTEEKMNLEDIIGLNNEIDSEAVLDVQHKPLPKSELYLSELRCGKILPGKWRRPSVESKDDVVILEDDMERVGQEIVEDTPAYVREEMRVKFYKFHDNRRPPYYGTWRKKSLVVKPRKPFAQDMKFFDYEVDSDDEWEEEEPGESLDGSDEDKEKESEDDDYEVDNEWFVPHGHLSDEELQNEDECGMGDDNTREAQKVKLQLLQQEFAQEMKKKTEKIKPRLIGCIWTDINGNQPSQCAKILWETLEKKAMLYVDSPLIEEPEADKSAEPNSPSSATTSNATEKVTDKLKPITLSDNMIKDLTRLVHGNSNAKNFLINEYIAYVEKTEESVKNGGLRKPLKSVVRDKIEEIAEWQAVDAHTNVTNNKKKKVKRRLCWVVKQEILDRMGLSSLELKNSWKYTLQPKFVKAVKDSKTEEGNATADNEIILVPVEETAKGQNSEITKFTKVLTVEEKASNLHKASSEKKTRSDDTIVAEPKPKEKKRVPLLMSVARGQQISTPTKNKLISQFLQQNKDSTKSSSPTTSRKMDTVASSNVKNDDDDDDDVVVILD